MVPQVIFTLLWLILYKSLIKPSEYVSDDIKSIAEPFIPNWANVNWLKKETMVINRIFFMKQLNLFKQN